MERERNRQGDGERQEGGNRSGGRDGKREREMGRWTEREMEE